MRYIRLGQSEHKFETRHSIDFSSTSILDMATGYMDRMIKEAPPQKL